MFNKQHAK
jgi:hypothetical protein